MDMFLLVMLGICFSFGDAEFDNRNHRCYNKGSNPQVPTNVSVVCKFSFDSKTLRDFDFQLFPVTDIKAKCMWQAVLRFKHLWNQYATVDRIWIPYSSLLQILKHPVIQSVLSVLSMIRLLIDRSESSMRLNFLIPFYSNESIPFRNLSWIRYRRILMETSVITVLFVMIIMGIRQ